MLIDFRRKGTPYATTHDPTPVDTGPQRPCVLTYRGRWYPFRTFYDAVQYGRSKGLVGALIRVCGCKGPDARIEPPVDLQAIAKQLGRPPQFECLGGSIFENTMTRRAVND